MSGPTLMGTMAYELHEPTFDGTTTDRWVEPDWEEIAGADPATVSGHFLLCEGGFPPESVNNLALPVVDGAGRLNRNALADAVYGDASVNSLDVTEEIDEAVTERCMTLLSEQFESMPESIEAVDDLLLAWRQHRDVQFHDIEQKRLTDDEERYYEAKGQRIETGEVRPEKGR